MGESALRLSTDRLTAMYGKFTAVKDVSLEFRANTVNALIGPSGCGKSTYLRTLNRMHELHRGRVDHRPGAARRRGHLRQPGEPDAAAPADRHGLPEADPVPHHVDLRQRGGGAQPERPASRRATSTGSWNESLRHAALWDEVKDRLTTSAIALSGGQQQRLCIARTIAPRPEVVLLDEPTASLDPGGTQRIEELVFELKRDFTIVIVTHNMQQAARVSDTTTFFYMGTMVETGPTRQIFTAPKEERTEAYITGRFG